MGIGSNKSTSKGNHLHAAGFFRLFRQQFYCAITRC